MRMLIRYIACCLLTALLVVPAFSAAEARPNVLMITVDDWNDWSGALGGNPQVISPNMDRLAARGMLFTDAHTAAPMCNPSRTAVMTGRRPATTGVYTNGAVWRMALPDVVTLPQYFRENGYHAAGGGKLFHHPPGYNDPRSWTEYFFWNPAARKNGWSDGYMKPPDAEPAHRPVTVMGAHRPNWDWAPLDNQDSDMPDHKVASWAAEFLEREHDRPFFLAVGLFKPHNPWFVPRKYFEMYPLEEIILPVVKEDDLDDIPAAGREIASGGYWRHDLVVSTGNWRKNIQAYLASITFSDAMLGRVIDALDGSKYRDNTIVVLWSDHGYHLGEKWHWHKWSLWDRATHVPLIVIAPGVTEPETHCGRPVSLVDVYPTLADLAGLPPKEGLDGQSLRPLLEKPGAVWERPALITYLRGNHALRSERWSYIRYADGSEELYDRRQDPHEWVNLADKPGMDTVKQELRRWLPQREAPDVPGPSQFRFDPATVTWTRGQKR